MLNKITVIIPIFNEGPNIGLLIEDIFSNFSKINILVIDDFSTDNSVTIVKNKIKKYNKNLYILEKNNSSNMGLTNSIILGINEITTDFFIVMDGDFQHPVINIYNFIQSFEAGNDIIIGEREEIVFEEKKYRILISEIGNYFINLKIKKTGLFFKDPLSGFFGGKSNIYKTIINKNNKKFLGRGYKFLFEFLKLLNIGEYKIQTFNFDFGKRKFGESKITLIIFIEFIKGFFQ